MMQLIETANSQTTLPIETKPTRRQTNQITKKKEKKWITHALIQNQKLKIRQNKNNGFWNWLNPFGQNK